jgi:hypothetical protein
MIRRKRDFRAVNHAEIGDATGLRSAAAPGDCQCDHSD